MTRTLTGVANLPLYPEERSTSRPTAEQVFRLFSLAQRHTLREQDCVVRTFHPELTALQLHVLELPGVPEQAYLSPTHQSYSTRNHRRDVRNVGH